MKSCRSCQNWLNGNPALCFSGVTKPNLIDWSRFYCSLFTVKVISPDEQLKALRDWVNLQEGTYISAPGLIAKMDALAKGEGQ